MLKPAAVLSLSVLLCACAPEDPLELRQEGMNLVRSPIVNGTRDPRAVDLTDAQILSIGWLYAAGSPSRIFCTGTLIAPNLVVTAAHCVYGAGAGEIGFGVGVDPRDPVATSLTAGVFPNRAVDAALLLLEDDLTAGDVEITPIPVNQDALDASDVGRAVQAGGYGDTYDPDTDGRWFATVYIDEITTELVVVDGRGEQGICFGDSGSGLIDLDADGNPVVLAVESGGDASCVDIDRMTRLDTIWDWIGPVLDGEIPADPCEGVGRTGRCVDNVAERCPRGSLRYTDCTELGTECAYIEEAERFACTCGPLTAEGWCDGDVAEYCSEGRYRQSNCSFRGGACGWDAAEGRYTCVDRPVCRPEDEAGRCEGDTAIRCVAGRTTRELCYAAGRECVETDDGVECVEGGVDGDADGDGDGDADGDGDGDADADADTDADADGDGEPDGDDEGGCSCRVASPHQSGAGRFLSLLLDLLPG